MFLPLQVCMFCYKENECIILRMCVCKITGGPVCSHVTVNRDISNPSIDVEWTYEPQLGQYLEVSQFEVILETIGSNDEEIDTPKHITIQESQHFAHIAVPNLFDCERVRVTVSAKRSDDHIIQGEAHTKEIAKGRSCYRDLWQ